MYSYSLQLQTYKHINKALRRNQLVNGQHGIDEPRSGRSRDELPTPESPLTEEVLRKHTLMNSFPKGDDAITSVSEISQEWATPRYCDHSLLPFPQFRDGLSRHQVKLFTN